MASARLILLRHAPTEATRARRFAADEPLDREAAAQARAARGAIGAVDRVLCSPLARARQTAEAMALDYALEPRVAECDVGAWSGLSYDEVRARFGAGPLEAWLADPSAAPHGGESLRDVAERVAGFMASARDLRGTTLVVTHGGVIRVALLLTRREPLERIWNVTVEPLSLAGFRAAREGWQLEGEPRHASANA